MAQPTTGPVAMYPINDHIVDRHLTVAMVRAGQPACRAVDARQYLQARHAFHACCAQIKQLCTFCKAWHLAWCQLLL